MSSEGNHLANDNTRVVTALNRTMDSLALRGSFLHPAIQQHLAASGGAGGEDLDVLAAANGVVVT